MCDQKIKGEMAIVYVDDNPVCFAKVNYEDNDGWGTLGCGDDLDVHIKVPREYIKWSEHYRGLIVQLDFSATLKDLKRLKKALK